MNGADRFPSFRAPRENGSILCAPSWAELPEHLLESSPPEAGYADEKFELPLEALAHESRQELLEAAQHYTNRYAKLEGFELQDGPLILSGHQPDLVHPGVWLKNFASARLARQLGGTSLSLIIDNDLCRTPSIRVPTGTIDEPRVVNVAYDQPTEQLPFEERNIHDRALWESFGERVAKTLSPLVQEPLVLDWWPEVLVRSQEVPQIGLAIAQARHQLELRWGATGLELPQSAVCQMRSFRKFALSLWQHAEEFRTAYNDSLALYRQAHRIRTPAQPLPNLGSFEEWTETPFWIWTSADRRRRSLFVRRCREGMQLSDRAGWREKILLSSESELSHCLDRLEAWETKGLRIRSKALITTLFARLLLADAFIHGIGGAKYDQVTNLLSEKYFGRPLPGYITISGTLHLPIPHQTVSSTQLTESRQTLRELRYHPELFLSQLSLDEDSRQRASQLAVTKHKWVQTPKTHENAAERHQHIEAANLKLQTLVAPLQVSAEQNLANTIGQFRANQVLESREYSFCLFPQGVLQDFLLDF